MQARLDKVGEGLSEEEVQAVSQAGAAGRRWQGAEGQQERTQSVLGDGHAIPAVPCLPSARRFDLKLPFTFLYLS